VRLPGFFLLILSACQGAPESAAAPKKPLRDFRGIIHCHSKYSHDSQGTYEEILAAAKAAKVDFICMTDHPPKGDPGQSLREGWTGIHDGVLFIQGAEFGEQILGLGLKDPISGKDRREKIREIHKQGGLAIACHPEMIVDWDEYEEADGMEIYNVHATLQRKAKDKKFLLQIPKVMKERPEECFQLLQELDPAILKKWAEINNKRTFAGIAGNDSHQNVSFFGYQLDPYPRAFRFVATHVLAEELTQEAILASLKMGRCYVKFAGGAPVRPPLSVEHSEDTFPILSIGTPGLSSPRSWVYHAGELLDPQPKIAISPSSMIRWYAPKAGVYWVVQQAYDKEEGTEKMIWGFPYVISNAVRVTQSDSGVPLTPPK